METKTYKAATEGWILGELRQKGDLVQASPAAAEYALMNGSIEEVRRAEEAAKDEAGASTTLLDASVESPPEADASDNRRRR